MVATFGSFIIEASDTIWFVVSIAPVSRIDGLELVELIDIADTGNKPAALMLLSELLEGWWLSADNACANCCNCSEEKFGMELGDCSFVFN